MKKSAPLNTKAALVRAATDLFAREGVEAASTRTIAKQAGVNAALIQYHFQNKQGLLETVLEDGVSLLLQRLAVAGNSGQPSPETRNRVLEAFLLFTVVEAPSFTALVTKASISSADSPVTNAVASALRPVSEFLRDAIQDGNMQQENQLAGMLFGLAATCAAMPSLGSAEQAPERLAQARRCAHALLGEVHLVETQSVPIRPAFSYPASPALDFVD